jgi:hypothetical protein
VALIAYCEWLPTGPDGGNILLADGEARVLNKLFTADEGILAEGFAARLSTFLEDHIALRVFYPELERYYHAVRTVCRGRKPYLGIAPQWQGPPCCA